jgi:hypothetical protein
LSLTPSEFAETVKPSIQRESETFVREVDELVTRVFNIMRIQYVENPNFPIIFDFDMLTSGCRYTQKHKKELIAALQRLNWDVRIELPFMVRVRKNAQCIASDSVWGEIVTIQPSKSSIIHDGRPKGPFPGPPPKR